MNPNEIFNEAFLGDISNYDPWWKQYLENNERPRLAVRMPAEALIQAACEQAVKYDARTSNDAMSLKIYQISAPRNQNPPWLDVRVGDSILFTKVYNLGAEPKDIVIVGESLRTAIKGDLPGKAFLEVWVDEMCGCEKNGTCGCRYKDLQQSLANRDERIRTAGAAGDSGSLP